MAITAKPQKTSAPDSSSVDVDRLINKGGTVAQSDDRTDEQSKKVLLRVPLDVLEDVDVQVKARRPKISRHMWMIESILQRLERDGNGK